MNFLAHLFLAGDDDASIIGNLAGDFVKGPLHERFEAGIRAGITEHRRIDAFTDSHPQVSAFRRVLIPEHGHYARVIADVFFDHFLALSFDEYSAEPLEEFLRRIYGVLDAHLAELPGRLGYVYPIMRDEGWIPSYRSIEGIETALRNMSHRLSRHPHLETSVHHLVDSRRELQRRFEAFFPDVIAFAERLRGIGDVKSDR